MVQFGDRLTHARLNFKQILGRIRGLQSLLQSLGLFECLILRFQKDRQLLLDALGGIRTGFRDASE